MEKYGTIPPKFTKDWWSHYWTYYKFHFLAGLFIAFSVGSLIHSCVTQIDYDLKIQYAAYGLSPKEEIVTKLEEKLTDLSEDVTANEKVEVYAGIISGLSEESPESIQYESAILTKFMAEIQTAENHIYIVDKSFADRLIDYECLRPVNEWADKFEESDLYSNVLLSLSNNETFANMGFNTENLYIGVLALREKLKADEEYMSKYENAVNVAKQLIKE